MKRERGDMDEEQRQRKLIAEQIEKARAEAGALAGPSNSSGSDNDGEEGVAAEEREESKPTEPIKLSLGSLAVKKPSPPAPPSTTAEDVKPSLSAPSIAPAPIKFNPLKANPLKSNPLKSASAPAKPVLAMGAKPTSAMEAIIQEEEARKRRREDATWSRGYGEGLQAKRPRADY